LFDALTGRRGSGAVADHAANPLWHFRTAGTIGTPAFDGTTVYFLDASHEVVALDSRTGAELWTASTGTIGGGTYGAAGCVVAGAVVACGDEDIVGVRRGDGALLWRYHATVGYSPGYFSLSFAGSTVYAGSPSGTMYAIDATSGTARWAVRLFPADTDHITVFEPTVDNDIVVAGYTKFPIAKPSRGGVAALDAATGQVRWIAEYPQPDTTIGTNGRTTVLWQNVVLGSSKYKGTIYAMDRATGAILWTLPGVGRNPARFGANLEDRDDRVVVVHGSTLYAASTSDWLVAYDLPSHMEMWRTESSAGSASTAPIVYDSGRVYVGLAGGQLVAFSATEPSVAWSTSGSPNFLGTVAVGADRIFASRVDGFYALSK
jgi:outer membrane protein assembly factor BamB